MGINNNFCHNSIYLTSEQRRELNSRLNSFFDEIRTIYESERIEANIYLSGSLARQEPSVIVDRQKRVNLFSDIDFVMVFNECHRDHWLVKHSENILKEIRPDINSTVQLVQVSRLNHVQSCFARDLSLSVFNPIYQNVKIPVFKAPRISLEDLFEVIIHQISGYFLYTKHKDGNKKMFFRSEEKYHYIKLVLECLRAQLIEVNHSRYCDVYANREAYCFQNILSPEQIEKFIQARELFGFVAPPTIDIGQFVERCVLKHLGFREVRVSFSDLYDRLRERSRKVSDSFTLYKYAIVTFVISINKSSTQKKMLLTLFSHILKQVDDPCLRATGFLREISQINWGGLTTPDYVVRERIIEAMRLYHVDYLHALTMRNLGWSDTNTK